MFYEIICFHKGVRILLGEIKHLSANTQKEVACLVLKQITWKQLTFSLRFQNALIFFS